VEQALRELRPLNAEISVRSWHRESAYEVGLIAFHPAPGGDPRQAAGDPRQILHRDRDVVCQVLQGVGRLRLEGETVPVEPGVLCRIPAGTPHDFAATGAEPLVLFYTLIAVAPP
jgi:mannose-6-phosphate isomerase-like protein (cupin superfamily)